MDRRVFLQRMLGLAGAAAVTGVAASQAVAMPLPDPLIRKDAPSGPEQAAEAGLKAPDGTPIEEAQYYYRRRRYYVRRRIYVRRRYWRRRYY